MSDPNQQPLGSAINDFLKTYNLREKIDGIRLIHAWEPIVGSMIAQHTTDLYVNKKTLYVYLDSPAIRHELSFASSLLIKRLNEAVQKEIIDTIVFR
jgi:predicted nucleic acid-binding Zn ribbon protein